MEFKFKANKPTNSMIVYVDVELDNTYMGVIAVEEETWSYLKAMLVAGKDYFVNENINVIMEESTTTED